MSDHPPPLIEAGILSAKTRAGAARGELIRSLVAVKERLTPKALLRSLGHAAAAKGLHAMEDGVERARERPVLATGIAALAALFLARKPILRSLAAEPFRKPDATARRPARSRSKSVRKGKS